MEGEGPKGVPRAEIEGLTLSEQGGEKNSWPLFLPDKPSSVPDSYPNSEDESESKSEVKCGEKRQKKLFS